MSSRRWRSFTISIFFSTFLFFSLFTPIFAATSFSYDPNGNLTSDGNQCYEYNDANKLVRVKNCGSNQLIAEYAYDYQGNRIVKKKYTDNQLEATTYTPGSHFETKVLPNSSEQNTSYYLLDNSIIARKNHDGSKVFYHNDHLSSTNLLTNELGQVVETTDYYPYGDVRSGGEGSKYLFTGQEQDSETGLYYYDSRYYNPQIARFIQPDTVLPNVYDPQQLNRYAYARNNPLRYTDSSGHYLESALDIAFISWDLKDIHDDPGNLYNYVALGVDVVGLALPGVTGGGRVVKLVEHSDDIVKAVGVGIDVAKGAKVAGVAMDAGKAVDAAEDGYKAFKAANFRDNLIKLTGQNPLDSQAHHVFPQKASLQNEFNKLDINIHDPKYGSWWDATKGMPGNHSSMAKQYNQDWTNFFTSYKNHGIDPTKTDVFNQANIYSQKYGFQLNFKL